MKARNRGPVMCPVRVIGTRQQTIWVKRGGKGGSGNSGPSGRRLRPAARHYRALAEMAASYRARKRK